jgi:hypothetical protein
MGQAQALFGQGYDFYALWRQPAAVISGGDGIDPDHFPVTQKPKVGSCGTLVTTVDGLHNIFYREHAEATGFGEQGLFLRAKSEAANIYCNALACTPRAMLYLTAFVDGILVGFDGAIQPRLRNVVGMVFAGAFLKFFDAPRERRCRNL